MQILQQFIRLFLLFLLAGCSTPRFSQGGYFFAGIDRYFNPKEELNIWVYYNFQPRETGEMGLRIKKLYPLDKQILKEAGLLKAGSRVLFTVVPDAKPYFNMLAIQHRKKAINLQDFEKKRYHDADYYQRDIPNGQFVIRQVYIGELHGRGISMIGYVSKAEEKLKGLQSFDYLTKINAYALKNDPKYAMKWNSQGMTGEHAHAIKLEVPDVVKKQHKPVFLMVYEKIHDDGLISNFQQITPKKDQEIMLNLIPGTFFLAYHNQDMQVVHRDTLTVDRR